MNIRYAQPTDFERILEIYNFAIPTHQITADLEYATPESRRQWFDFHLASEKYPIWVVEEDNHEVVGWFSFSPFYERSAFAPTSEISIYLHPNAKGKGYGSQIIEFMQQQMQPRGIFTLMAYVFELNTVSQNLMKKHGFQQWGRFPNIALMGKDEQGNNKWRTFLMMSYQIELEK
ncbi:GNAT family N-acetyltransferase [Haemophilus paracuniculus]|uniref:GNAT family N-acetyltransferase n=1 Tax=Haemophilus paracuniculus TaxID=734 RepID=A0A1T0ASN6_9PAST|nr:GNAT family N-acetyltransferase [Haemophilus paracuniculus]OOR99438.1 GNAT family N-acetyltransferase [Haemophilus paracuniculus]